LIAGLHRPLMDLFENHIPGLKPARAAPVERVWGSARASISEYAKLETEVYGLVKRIKGQTVPGHLFNRKGAITLPSFSIVQREPTIMGNEGVIFRPDILAEGPDAKWVIEVKASFNVSTPTISQLLMYKHALGATPWLIAFSSISNHARSIAAKNGILLTASDEWEELKKLLAP